jgi:hypothetical protein
MVEVELNVAQHLRDRLSDDDDNEPSSAGNDTKT